MWIYFSFVPRTKRWSSTETSGSGTTPGMWCEFPSEIKLHLLFLSSQQLWSGTIFWFTAASGASQNSCHTQLQSAALAYQLNLLLVPFSTEWEFVLGVKQKESEAWGVRGEQCSRGKKKKGKKTSMFMQESYTELIKSGLDICLVWLYNSGFKFSNQLEQAGSTGEW